MRHGLYFVLYLCCLPRMILAAVVLSLPVELTALNITNAIDVWERDMAVMFYTPWCHGCKQFVPYWEAMSLHYSTKGDLILGNLNCDEHEHICSVLGVTAYPSFVFFGFGSLGRQKSSRVPQCASEFPLDVIDYDAVMDWISLLSWLSRFNRMSDYFRNFFSSRSVASHFANDQNTERDATIATLTAEVRRLNAELDRRKALDLFDSLPNHGDPYPLLNALTIDETASLRGCVTDMMRDYCSFETDEKHCDEIRGNDCLSTNLTHEV